MQNGFDDGMIASVNMDVLTNSGGGSFPAVLNWIREEKMRNNFDRILSTISRGRFVLLVGLAVLVSSVSNAKGQNPGGFGQQNLQQPKQQSNGLGVNRGNQANFATASNPQTGAANPGSPQGNPRFNSGPQTKPPLPEVRKAANQMLPRPFPELSEAHIQYLNQLLDYWEKNSDKIKRYHCRFTNWTYNSMQVPMADPKSNHVFAQTISVGTVKFASPDKGLFHAEKVWAFDRELYANQKDPFKESPELRQRWHCDGKAVYEFLYTRKELVETPIPEEMRGERIVDGPLPFLFGAKSADLKSRYWMRVITPKERGEKGEYWLEAFPKYRADAANFQKVEIVLEKTDFLPAVLTLFAPEHDLVNGKTIVKQTIKFDKRKIWESENSTAFGSLFDELLHPPKTPFSWKRVNTQLRDTARNTTPNGQPQVLRK
ncbi:MAG: hypothetical protein P8M80_00170 [Pirellulaceae bacterium]|nr:hypothetical protein [Pirellulaceae bacterium]